MKKKHLLQLIGIGLLTHSMVLAKERTDIYHKDWIDFNKNGKMDIPCHCDASYFYLFEVCVFDRLCAERVHGADAGKGQLYHRLPDIFQSGDRRYHYIPA